MQRSNSATEARWAKNGPPPLKVHAVSFAMLLIVAACESASSNSKDTTAKSSSPPLDPAASVAEATKTNTNPPAKPSAQAATSSIKESIRRPKNRGELVLTTARRTKLEAAFPQAKGFLDLVEVEKQIHKRDLTRGKPKGGIKLFDKLAAGKWLLFVGNIMKPTDKGFELAVRYTPRDPKDRLGLSANWFPVTFTSVEGYEGKNYRPGELIAVLGKYRGKQQVSKAHDVVFLRHWDFRTE